MEVDAPRMIVSAVIGIVVGVGVAWLMLRQRAETYYTEILAQKGHEVASLRGDLEASRIDLAKTATQLDERTSRLDTLAREFGNLSEEQTILSNENKAQAANIAALETSLAAERQQHDEKLSLLKDQFKALAHDILEEKAKRFTEQNQTNLTQLLDPLKTKLHEFQGKVEEVYVQESKDRTALGKQVEQLATLNQQLSQDAHNLTRALKGESKTQGNWGEVILERVLEAAGLRKGFEYDVQQGFQKSDGGRAILDVIVHMPEDRHLIVDSKVSLTAYEEYSSAESDGDREACLKRHVDSVRNHVKALSAKDYESTIESGSLDFVVMFVPVEPAFLLAIGQDVNLWQTAWAKNILLVSPSSLLFVLRSVAYLWRQDKQSRNLQEIVSRGASLYDKLVGFVDDLLQVGQRLKQAQDEHQAALGKLSTDRDNVILQAEKLKGLGLKPKESLPKRLIDQSGSCEPSPESEIVVDPVSEGQTHEAVT